MLYLVEGNIGTGKSTFLKLIQETMPQAQVVFESVDYWQQQEDGASILHNFYSDPVRWAYTMETLALKMRVQQHIAHQDATHPVFIERSIYSGYHCFAMNSYKQGFLSPVEWNIYKQWFEFATHNQCKKPDGIIYLQADAHMSHARTLQRNRNAEQGIPLTYLEQIHETHEQFLISKETMHTSLHDVPVLTMNCNQDFTHSATWHTLREQVQNFIAQTDATVKTKHTNFAQQL